MKHLRQTATNNCSPQVLVLYNDDDIRGFQAAMQGMCKAMRKVRGGTFQGVEMGREHAKEEQDTLRRETPV
jgi:hypothetical protein